MDVRGGDALESKLAGRREEMLAVIYDRFGAALFHVALTLLGHRQNAEDAVQEVFLSLARASTPVAAIGDLRAYLFKALHHTATKLRNKVARERADSPDSLINLAGPEPRPVELSRAAQLERALRELPVEQRELIALKIDGGLTFAEIAACLGINPNTAASRYRYALEKLRARIGGLGHDS